MATETKSIDLAQKTAILSGMARPPKKASDRRTAIIKVPLTAAEKRKVVRKAKAIGMTTAAWLRRLALGE